MCLSCNCFLLGLNGAAVLYYFFVHEMALLVEALNILLNGIWSVLEVGAIRLNLHDFDSIAVPKGRILTNLSKIQGWRNFFNFKFSIKERLPSKISAVLRFHEAVQPIKDVFVNCRNLSSEIRNDHRVCRELENVLEANSHLSRNQP